MYAKTAFPCVPKASTTLAMDILQERLSNQEKVKDMHKKRENYTRHTYHNNLTNQERSASSVPLHIKHIQSCKVFAHHFQFLEI
mmetsp:Transcript_22154/g.32211  ORF Transcript_22154/g.32211 Transcript_22154/m.32211 type:complete len:84 (-) Transcript_22154:2729-2980(-)